MHPARVTDRLTALRKRWENTNRADQGACRDLAIKIGCRQPTWDRIGTVLDICELMWLSWQYDMRDARVVPERIASLLRESKTPPTNTDGGVLIALMHQAVQAWGARRIQDIVDKPLSLVREQPAASVLMRPRS